MINDKILKIPQPLDSKNEYKTPKIINHKIEYNLV
jgi:hypothetical protein